MSHLQLNNSDIYHFYRPTRCERRLYLATARPDLSGSSANTPREADLQIERHLLKSLSHRKDLSRGPAVVRLRESLKAWLEGATVLYKPLFQQLRPLGPHRCEFLLEPDFLMRTGEGYILKLCRNAQRVNRENHADLLFLAQYQGWLASHIFAEAPQQIEIAHQGSKPLIVAPADPELLEAQLLGLLDLKAAQEMPYSPISWTRCQACDFRPHCWAAAEASQDLALIPNLEARLLLALRATGAQTIPDFLAQFSEERLAAFSWYEGQTPRRLGPERARQIRLMADVVLSGRPRLLTRPELPATQQWAMFDLEGIPARQGCAERVYLWGLSLMQPDHPEQNLQTFSPDLSRKADQQAWFTFLAKAGDLFAAHGDLPFVHWGNYEPQSLRLYVRRYGDRDGIARRIEHNLLDFWALLKDTVLIPLPSYSLKVIEAYVGFDRPDKETGGYWSVVNYLKSTSTRNVARQQRIQQELLAYNHADLVAMWHVVQWFSDFLAST